ncbi:hypothetical protein [Nostoc sp.]
MFAKVAQYNIYLLNGLVELIQFKRLLKHSNTIGIILRAIATGYLTAEIMYLNHICRRGTALLIGVNLSQNPFKTSFPARGWKCTS